MFEVQVTHEFLGDIAQLTIIQFNDERMIDFDENVSLHFASNAIDDWRIDNLRKQKSWEERQKLVRNDKLLMRSNESLVMIHLIKKFQKFQTHF